MDIVIDRLVRSPRRTVGLKVTPDGRLEVRAPRRLPEAEVRRLVRSKAAWIRRTQEAARARHAERPAHRYATGETFPLLGEPCRLEIVEGREPRLEFDGGFRLTRSGVPCGKALFEAWYRRRAAEAFAERAALWGGRMAVGPARLLLSGARTKWGSCDARGTVRLAWRLVMAPPAVLDYVVVHELAHLAVRGHARRFWDLVGAFDPDYRAHRRWLAERGHTLGL
jgi:hypothetical protein